MKLNTEVKQKPIFINFVIILKMLYTVFWLPSLLPSNFCQIHSSIQTPRKYILIDLKPIKSKYLMTT